MEAVGRVVVVAVAEVLAPAYPEGVGAVAFAGEEGGEEDAHF